jgi:hypothetical protein
VAYYLRTVRHAYDNIAVGAATGRERTAGTLTSPWPTGGIGGSAGTGGERWISASGGVSTHTTATALNRIIDAAGTGRTTLSPAENIKSTQ